MSFDESLTSGLVGELIVWNALNHLETVRTVIDVRDDKKFQSMDVDFLVEMASRQVIWLEVKTDYKATETGNIVYELTTSGNVGCFEKTKADVIAYYVPTSGCIYLINVKKLRNYVRSCDYPLKKMGDASEGYLLPIAELERENVIYFEHHAERIAKWMDG